MTLGVVLCLLGFYDCRNVFIPPPKCASVNLIRGRVISFQLLSRFDIVQLDFLC